jgi:anti-anti-sigma factor
MSEDQIGRTIVPEAAEFTEGTVRPAIELSEHQDTAVVCLRGPVDAALTPNLRDALTWAVRHHTAVFVDLSAVSAVDAAGLGALIRAHRRASSRGVALCLVAPSQPVLSALRAPRLSDMFTVVDGAPTARRGPRPGMGRSLMHARI